MQQSKMRARSASRRINRAVQYGLPLAAMALAAPAYGLTFNLTFDTTVNNDTNATAIKSACNYVAQQYQNLYSDPVTINITVSENSSTGFLGGSNTPLVVKVVGGAQVPFSYSDVRNALTSDSKSTNDGTFVANDLPASAPTGSNGYVLPRAQAKAIGLLASDATNDGTFQFGNAAAGDSYTYDPTNRTVAGQFDFIGVADHEFSELMGRISDLGQVFNIGGTATATNVPYDLARFKASASRSLNQTDPGVYFSINNGATNLKNYNNPGGGDLSDWASGTSDAYNAFTGTGVTDPLTLVDSTVMDVIGYDLANLVWNGQADHTTWDIFNTKNWHNSTSTTATYTDSAFVVFDDTSTGGNSITLNQSVNPLAVTVSSSTNNYTISGTGSITGLASLTKSGTSKLIIATNNTYSGGTTISGGTLQVGNAGTVGSLGTGAVTDNAALAFNRTDSFSFANTVTGTGSLTQAGTGTLTLTATNNTYSGGTTVSAGTLTIGAAGALPSGSNVTNNAALTIGANTTAGNVSGTGTTTVNSGKTFVASGFTQGGLSNAGSTQINGSGTTGQITGAGTLTLGTVAGPNTNTLALSLGSGQSTQSALTVNPGSTLDLINNSFDIHYGAGASPDSTIRSLITSGRNGGTWNGTGITSSRAADQTNHPGGAVGYANGADGAVPGLAAGDELVRYTLAGDANLDGTVSFSDFQVLAENFGAGGKWDQADFNYDGQTSFSDFQLLAENFGNTASLSSGQLSSLQSFAEDFGDSLIANASGQGFTLVAVPEPASLGLLGLGAIGLLARRRRRK